MKEYIYKDKIKYRLKFKLEKIPYKKRKRAPRVSREEKLLKEADLSSRNVLLNKRISEARMVDRRLDLMWDNEDFIKVKKIGEDIRKIEVFNYFLFALATALSVLACLIGSFLVKSSLFFLGVIPLMLVNSIIFKSKVTFKDFYKQVYLPMCYHCANVFDESEGLTFRVYDKKNNWDRKRVNKKIITNRFKVFAKNVTASVEKMIVRNYITTYSMKRGKINIGKKLATIFSGYSFEMNFENNIEDPDKIRLAIINSDTFYGTDGLYKEDASILKLNTLNCIPLDSKWKVYINNSFDFSKKDIHEIQKKILMITNAIGTYNVYLTGNSVRMMMSVKTNKDGLQEEKFQSQLKYPEKITYGGCYSVVKTLYCIYCMKRLIRVVYGKKFDIRTNVEKSKKSMITKKVARIFKDEKERKKHDATFNSGDKREKSPVKKEIANKYAEGTVSFAVKLLITLSLCALIFMGFIRVINRNYAGNVLSQTELSSGESRDTVDIDDIK